MQINPSSPEQTSEHLSPVAAKMMLAAFPERIQRALFAHAAETSQHIESIEILLSPTQHSRDATTA